jgi:hypothetical protein
VFARFTINTTTTDGNFVVRDITNGVNSVAISGTVRIRWVLNNSGASINYKAPDGTFASLANDKADIWAGNTQLFNDVNVQTGSQTMADMKFIMNQGSETIEIDNILVDPVLPPNYAYTATNVSGNSFTANWSSVTGATGYRIDVSKLSNFSTYVSGFEDLFVSGSTSVSVTGLTWGNTYYYRVRPTAKYNAGEFEADNSNVMNVVTGILPLTFIDLKARPDRSTVAISFSVTEQSGVHHYVVEREDHHGSFVAIGRIRKIDCCTEITEYSFIDHEPQAGINLYRVAAILNDGMKEVSSITYANFNSREPILKIRTNPIVNSQLQLDPINLPEGEYSVMISTANGELLLNKKICFRKGTCITIPVHSYRAGIYNLRIKGAVTMSEWFTVIGH